jgi:cytosine/adenosine deaminase-related metal-dependent hydrolase
VREGRLLIRGGHLVTMDDATLDLARGDVLVEGSRIEAIRQDIPADDAEVIDARGMIVMPGMVDGHKHTWQTIFRGTGGNQTLQEFFGEAVPATAPHLQPDDVYASNLLGAVDALHAGVTTILDWCHATLTPDHSRAAFRALRESGIRAWFAHGPSLLTWSDREADHPADLRAIRNEMDAADGRVRLAMAARGPMFAELPVTIRDFSLARDLGIPISVHVDMPGYPGEDVLRLGDAGVLGPDVCLLHGNTITEREIEIALEAGCTFVDSSVCDVLMGIGSEITHRLLSAGAEFGISPDTPVVNPTDLFWTMRATLLLERSRAYRPTFEADAQPMGAHLSARRMVEAATIHGARAIWMGDQVGSLSPGKRADIVLLDGAALGLAPMNDPTEAICFDASPGNVDTVLVDGQIVKRGGRMVGVDVDRVRQLAVEARDRVFEAAARNGYQPRWRAAASALPA